MKKYHINHEGKIYPCRAKVMKCPYSEHLHSTDKIKLYYKLMSSKENEVEPSFAAENELRKINRLKSLFSMSNEIANSDSPIELITHTLKDALVKIQKYDLEEVDKRWERFVDNESEEVYAVLNSGYKIPQNVPREIAELANEKFIERRRAVPEEYANSSRNEALIRARRRLANKDYSSYNKYKKDSLNKDNYQGTLRWIAQDFERFSHDLNTSRMITQPIFYGDIDKSREHIRRMSDYELLAAYDDYSVTDREIEENVKEANYFKFTPRRDLSDGANKKIAEWYNLNQKIYRNWKVNTPKRILLSMEIADELDSRGVYRQDSSIHKMIKEKEL